MHSSSISAGGVCQYAQMYPSTFRYVAFNADGSYNSRGGHNSSSAGCVGQSITQLYEYGRAFDFVTSERLDSTGAESMFPGLPDAINCGSSGRDQIFWMHTGNGTSGSIHYYQVSTGVEVSVIFNSDRTYSSRNGPSDLSWGCLGQSIAQLYSSGKAFNLVSSKNESSVDTTMIENWPDVIRCGSGSQEGAVYFLQNGGSHNAGWYVQVTPIEYRFVNFHANDGGVYNDMWRVTESSSGCLGQSISQLYALGRCFDFKNQDLTPTSVPSTTPTSVPSTTPTSVPSAIPTSAPSAIPTSAPSTMPTSEPSDVPTSAPSAIPTAIQTVAPSPEPTTVPTIPNSETDQEDSSSDSSDNSTGMWIGVVAGVAFTGVVLGALLNKYVFGARKSENFITQTPGVHIGDVDPANVPDGTVLSSNHAYYETPSALNPTYDALNLDEVGYVTLHTLEAHI